MCHAGLKYIANTSDDERSIDVFCAFWYNFSCSDKYISVRLWEFCRDYSVREFNTVLLGFAQVFKIKTTRTRPGRAMKSQRSNAKVDHTHIYTSFPKVIL